MALALVGGAPSFADNTIADGDGTTPIVASALDLGNVCAGSTASDTVLVAITRNGNYPSTNVFKAGSTATVSVLSTSGAGLSASVGSATTIGIPSTWETATNGTLTTAVTSSVSFVAGNAPATLSGSISYRSSGVRSTDDTALTREQTMSVTANVVNCNMPPHISVSDETLQGNTLGGRTLAFSDIGSATDAEDVTPSVSCTPALGSVLPLGTTTVTCTAKDSQGSSATDSGMVTVEDRVAPSIDNVPSSANVEATSAGGATFTYVTPTATDVVWGTAAVSCVPASGATFPLGASTVTCTATDGSTNTASAKFAVNVQDKTAPVITTSDVTAEGNTLGGANVSFTTPTALDSVDGSTQVTCDKSSGDFFPLGSTTVSCASSDKAGNTNTAAFVVKVTDTNAPVITALDRTVEGNTTGGANATFTGPTATDIVDGPTDVTCTKNSGDFFPLGSTTVTCTSSDASWNTSETTFSVTVTDTTKPSLLGVPADDTVEGDTTGGALYAYTDPTATDIVDANPSVSCSPRPGLFPLGTTTVTCTAKDHSGNEVSDSFTVTVQDTTAPAITFKSRTTANVNGWNNTAVAVTWACTDLVSGVVDDTVTTTVSAEGENQSATGTCEDNSGNKSSATTTGINIDKTPPDLGVTGAPSGEYTACSVPAKPTFAPADGLSGIAPTPQEAWTTPLTASGVGSYAYSATATDKAGNTATDSRTYRVIYGSAFGGFLQPINNDGSSRFKLGSTVPVKLQVTCGAVPVTSAVVKLNVKKFDSNPDPGTDEAISTAASTTGNLFRYSDPQYIFNLSTKAGYTNPGSTTAISFVQGTWTISAILDDGTYRSVNIQLVK